MSSNLISFAAASGVEFSDASSVFESILEGFSPCETGFETANAFSVHLSSNGWTYGVNAFSFEEVIESRSGNCLGLCCLYGCMLEFFGFEPNYQIAINPSGFQQPLEHKILESLLSGEVFDYSRPLLPQQKNSSAQLLFSSMKHPRIVFEQGVFETTMLERQDSSSIQAEVEISTNFDGVSSYVTSELARKAIACGDLEIANSLISQLEKQNPDFVELWLCKNLLAVELLDEALLIESRESFCELASSQGLDNNSDFFWNRYCLFGDSSDLDAGLGLCPTDMKLWFEKNVRLCEDICEARANFAVAAQCIARSEILHLGNFYVANAAVLARLFPDLAVGLILSSKDEQSDCRLMTQVLRKLAQIERVPFPGDFNLECYATDLNTQTPFQSLFRDFCSSYHPQGSNLGVVGHAILQDLTSQWSVLT